MKLVSYILLILLVISCSSEKKPLLGETEWQRQKNAQFKDASTSPLTEKDLKEFTGLSFFPYNEKFKIRAFLNRTPDSEWFDMPTTTSRKSKERLYGILNFKIGDKELELNIYQGADYLNTPGQETTLFLPFLDQTNGEDTYGGGRYLEVQIPEGDSIEIDFNRAFNPYCVYNEKFSCPLVPRDNYVSMRIEAGEKNFGKKD